MARSTSVRDRFAGAHAPLDTARQCTADSSTRPRLVARPTAHRPRASVSRTRDAPTRRALQRPEPTRAGSPPVVPVGRPVGARVSTSTSRRRRPPARRRSARAQPLAAVRAAAARAARVPRGSTWPGIVGRRRARRARCSGRRAAALKPQRLARTRSVCCGVGVGLAGEAARCTSVRDREAGQRRARRRDALGELRRVCSARPIAARTASLPDCSGTCRCGQNAGVSASASSSAGVRSSGSMLESRSALDAASPRPPRRRRRDRRSPSA